MPQVLEHKQGVNTSSDANSSPVAYYSSNGRTVSVVAAQDLEILSSCDPKGEIYSRQCGNVFMKNGDYAEFSAPRGNHFHLRTTTIEGAHDELIARSSWTTVNLSAPMT